MLQLTATRWRCCSMPLTTQPWLGWAIGVVKGENPSFCLDTKNNLENRDYTQGYAWKREEKWVPRAEDL